MLGVGVYGEGSLESALSFVALKKGQQSIYAGFAMGCRKRSQGTGSGRERTQGTNRELMHVDIGFAKGDRVVKEVGSAKEVGSSKEIGRAWQGAGRGGPSSKAYNP